MLAFSRLSRIFLTSLGLAALLAAPVAAVQFTPSATARLHTLGTGQPGAEWNTGANGVSGGQLSYDSGTTTLTLTGVLDTMNYFDTADVTCPTDVGSNCVFNFVPDLTFSLTAAFVGLAVTPLGGTFFNVQANFGTTGGVDLTVTDGTTDVLKASWVAGTFTGTPTTGLSTSVVWDTATSTVLGGTAGVTAVGFLTTDPATLFADLFKPDFFGITFGTLANFSDGGTGGLDEIIGASIAALDLVSFTADGNGQWRGNCRPI